MSLPTSLYDVQLLSTGLMIITPSTSITYHGIFYGNILAMKPTVAILTPGWDISINLEDKPLKIKK